MFKENLEQEKIQELKELRELKEPRELKEIQEFQKKKSQVNIYQEEFEEDPKSIDYKDALEDIKDKKSNRWMRLCAFGIVFIIVCIQILTIDYFFYKISIKQWALTDHQLNLFVGATVLEIYAICKIIIAYLFPDNKGFIVSVIEAWRNK